MARILALILVVPLLAAPVGVASAAQAPASAPAKHVYTPRPGPTFNSPVGTSGQKRAIFSKILHSVQASPRGSEIKILSWNFLTREGANALLQAQKRGVRVRLLMDKGNLEDIDNQPFHRLKRGLSAGNRKARLNSWARVCSGSCRGRTGSAHAKVYLFSQVGKAHNVVIQGSANFTKASGYNQWNDIYTYTGQRKIYDFLGMIFNEAIRDKPAKKAYARRAFGKADLIMFPLGKAHDPIMKLLNQVTCRNAANTASHRTRIRIAPDVMRQPRGMRLATKVRELWNQGCDIRIGYTVMGVDVGRMLRSPSGRGPVPMKHLVQDFDGDGEFDNYFHLKAMTIVGNVGKTRGGYITVNGSANWSSLSGVSDENLGVFRDKGVTMAYQKHLNYWYEHFPKSDPTDNGSNLRVARSSSADQLVFGTGKDAVYEDGTPYSTTGVDPYANMPTD